MVADRRTFIGGTFAVTAGLALPLPAGSHAFLPVDEDGYAYAFSSITSEVTPVRWTFGAPESLQNLGQPLSGANKYTLTFAKDATLSVQGPWWISMHRIDQGYWFVVPNALNKFHISYDDNLRYNADGSLTFYFQNESPGPDKEANWLPAPKGPFIPILRMRWPKENSPAFLWNPPRVVKIG